MLQMPNDKVEGELFYTQLKYRSYFISCSVLTSLLNLSGQAC